jgi:hypothetical protein
MNGSKEYFLKLQEETYNQLGNDEKMYLNSLGLEVRQLPTDEDLQDEKVKLYKKEIAKNYENLNSYLFDKRNKRNK